MHEDTQACGSSDTVRSVMRIVFRHFEWKYHTKGRVSANIFLIPLERSHKIYAACDVIPDAISVRAVWV